MWIVFVASGGSDMNEARVEEIAEEQGECMKRAFMCPLAITCLNGSFVDSPNGTPAMCSL